MASNMQDIKRRIKSVNSTEHITNAMKLVSAAKLRRAKATFEKSNQYFRAITADIEGIFQTAEELPSIYVKAESEIKKVCYIVITSNKGLCGAFNSNVIKEAEAQMRDCDAPPVLIAIGTKGRDYFSKRGYYVDRELTVSSETITLKDVRDIKERVFELYCSGEIDEVKLIYTSFKNNMEQVVVASRILPFYLEDDMLPIETVEPQKAEIEYEPSPEEVFDYLIPKYVEIKLYGAVVESATCEHAARRMAMENATDNARDMLGSLSLFYNRARQSAITNEIIEVVSGAEAQN